MPPDTGEPCRGVAQCVKSQAGQTTRNLVVAVRRGSSSDAAGSELLCGRTRKVPEASTGLLV